MADEDDETPQDAVVETAAARTSSTKEVSGQQLLASFLTDEDLNDITLQGTDSVRVKANRYVLAAKSDVLRQMLLGGFSEASSPIIQLDYEGNVLQALVEYIYTDSADILAINTRKRDGDENPRLNIGQIQLLVSLMEAANFFNLPNLCEKTQECVSKTIKAWPQLSFVILEACKHGGPSLPPRLKRMAISRVRRDVGYTSIQAKDVACLSPVVLEEVLQDTKMKMNELQLFKIVLEWVNASTTSTAGIQLDPATLEERQAAAKDLVKHIHLEKIHPKDLSTTVRPSGLVSTERILSVYEQHALKSAENATPGIYERPRYFPWTNTVDGSRIPPAILVEGAGQEAVNGVYRVSGYFGGGCRYMKRGTFMGQNCVFSILQCETSSSSDHWYVSISGSQPGTTLDVDFYATPVSEDRDVRPPSGPWITVEGHGLEPPPTILYRCSNDGSTAN